jgi:hypothetical protein
MADVESQTSAPEITPEVIAQPSPAQAMRDEAERNRLMLIKLREERGDFRVPANASYEEFARIRDASEKAGAKTTIEEASGPQRDAAGKFTSAEEQSTEDDSAPDAESTGEVDENHEYRTRLASAKEYYGDSVLNAAAQRLANAPVSPGIAKMFASFENGPDMLIELSRHEAPEQVAAFLSTMPRAQAEKYLTEISEALGGKRQTPQIQSKAPKPITPISKSAPTDNRLSDDLPFKEWVKRREAAINRK